MEPRERLSKQMDEAEQRHIARDSLFVMADLRLDGETAEHRIKVRNLSAGGMMGEGPVKVVRGALVWINVRNIGWVEGSIAWVQDSRFGIAFRDEIDPRVARAPLAVVEPASSVVRIPASQSAGVVRKV